MSQHRRKRHLKTRRVRARLVRRICAYMRRTAVKVLIPGVVEAFEVAYSTGPL